MNTIYSKNLIPGELWLRDSQNNKVLASQKFEKIFAKYQILYPAFYEELMNNQITRFDVFFDCIFVETLSGCLFEKLITTDLGEMLPYSDNILYTPRSDPAVPILNFVSSVDFWFDEINNKIYFCNISGLAENIDTQDSSFSFLLNISTFDCKTNTIQTGLFDKITIAYDQYTNWSISTAVFESPKITLNPDTNTFNVSFLVKNNFSEFGLLSINFKSDYSLVENVFKIINISAYLPFLTLNSTNSQFEPYLEMGYAPNRLLIVSPDFTNGPKFLKVPLYINQQLVDKYLTLTVQ